MAGKKTDSEAGGLPGSRITGINEFTSVMPELVNGPMDAPTILVEGMCGVAISSTLTKLHFVEHLPVDETLKARILVTLAIPNDQFAKIVDALAEIRARLSPPEESES